MYGGSIGTRFYIDEGLLRRAANGKHSQEQIERLAVLPFQRTHRAPISPW